MGISDSIVKGVIKGIKGTPWLIKNSPRLIVKAIAGRLRVGWFGMSKEWVNQYIPCDQWTKQKCRFAHIENMTIPAPRFHVDCDTVIQHGALVLHNIKTKESRFVTVSNLTLQDINHDIPNIKAARDIDDEDVNNENERDEDQDDQYVKEPNGPHRQEFVNYNSGNDGDAEYLQNLYGYVLVADPETTRESSQFELRMCPGDRFDEYWTMATFLWYGRLNPTTLGDDDWRSRMCIEVEAVNNTDSESEYLLMTTMCAGQNLETGRDLGFIYGPQPAHDVQSVVMISDGEANTTEPLFRVTVDDNHVLKMPYFNATPSKTTHQHGHAGDWRLQLA